MPVTTRILAEYRLGRRPKTLDDFREARLVAVGNCRCGAELSVYTSYLDRDGYMNCRDCIGDDGWETVEAADRGLFHEDAKSWPWPKPDDGKSDERTPYPWCDGNPTRADCARQGYCSRDPNCGE